MRLLPGGALLALALLGPWARAGAQDRPTGHRVRVTQPGSLSRLRGELIAVSLDSLWLLRDSTLVAVPTRNLARVEVKRRPMGAGDIMLWGVIGGAVSGAALTAACASYTDGCGAVLPAIVLTWTLWSGLWATVTGSAYQSYPAVRVQRDLPAFARFPQGLPDRFRPRSPPAAPADTGVRGPAR